jgi:hypothetical protein
MPVIKKSDSRDRKTRLINFKLGFTIKTSFFGLTVPTEVFIGLRVVPSEEMMSMPIDVEGL